MERVSISRREMIFAIILFISALLISGVAAYYSIVGLVAIFSSAVIASIVMGIALEVAKLVSASWLYRNWKEAPRLLKYYFTIAVLILSLITSMGIFGYLSKAHLDQSATTGSVAANVEIIDDKINIEKDNIATARKALKQLDESVDQVMARSSDEKGADKATSMRRSQQKERKAILASIDESQKAITKLQVEKAPIAADLRKIETEVGPIKYIAELIYGESSVDVIDKSVRLIIILIICVFDPLAILLIIAANMEMRKGTPQVRTTKEEKIIMPSAVIKVKPKKPSVPKKKPLKKKPSPVKKKPLRKKTAQNTEEFIKIKKNTVYRFGDGKS